MFVFIYTRKARIPPSRPALRNRSDLHPNDHGRFVLPELQGSDERILDQFNGHPSHRTVCRQKPNRISVGRRNGLSICGWNRLELRLSTVVGHRDWLRMCLAAGSRVDTRFDSNGQTKSSFRL